MSELNKTSIRFNSSVLQLKLKSLSEIIGMKIDNTYKSMLVYSISAYAIKNGIVFLFIQHHFFWYINEDAFERGLFLRGLTYKRTGHENTLVGIYSMKELNKMLELLKLTTKNLLEIICDKKTIETYFDFIKDKRKTVKI